MKLTVKGKLSSYEVIVKKDGLQQVGTYFSLQRKVLILTDDGVPEAYYQQVARQCFQPVICIIKQGEESKNLDNYQQVIRMMIHHQFTRGDCLVSVGGGVVGDLGGFVSATFMRGIDFYNIPTTLLAQLDSSIGGKTAIDFDSIKNLIGSFYPPKKVLIDPLTLRTLNQRQLHAGLVEAIKMAATCSSSLFEKIQCSVNLQEDLQEIIIESLKIKKAIVEEDMEEKNLRRVLNFGHSFGHVIESASHYQLLHGEAVGIGMLYFSSKEVQMKLRQVLEKYQLPVCYPLKKSDVEAYLKHDKKKIGDSIWIVYVLKIGSYELKKMSMEALYDYLREDQYE